MTKQDFFALGIGHKTTNLNKQTIDCFFPNPIFRASPEEVEGLSAYASGTSEISPSEALQIKQKVSPHLVPDALIEADKPLTMVYLQQDNLIDSVEEAYLKLHLLSHRLTLPNTLNLGQLFEHLPTVAWTNFGPIDALEINDRIIEHRVKGEHLEVYSVDKFPKMTNYVIPQGVRIADSSRIRLGAYLGEGTTVMHEGFINFNAGAHGPNMVEGRISQGVVIGEGSDLGGSASTMGTLSGGGEIRISIGKNCLVGANAGTGIPLGDRCTIEAGLYITSGMVISVLDQNNKEIIQINYAAK